MKTKRIRNGVGGILVTITLMVGIAILSNITAQAQYPYGNDPYGSQNNVYRIASQQGYRDGVVQGQEHARKNKRYNPEGTSKFKDAKEGYRSEYGNKDAYKQSYRDGFRRGYDRGFGQNGTYGGYDPQNGHNYPPYENKNDPYYGNNDPYYGNDRNVNYGGNGRNDLYRIAREQGYRDGVDHGAEHAREGKSYNPEGTKHYKQATEGYRSEYGSKDTYKQVYRDSFRRGYDQGFYRYNNGTSTQGTQRNRARDILGTILRLP